MQATIGMVGSAGALEALASGRPLDALAAQWTVESASFLREREAALLYSD